MPIRPGVPVEEFYERLLRRIGERAVLEVRPQIPSQTLQDALVLELSTSLVEPRAVLYIPHYWAVYLHDGRGPVKPTQKTWLVWFQNPEDDPRTAGGRRYPVRANDIATLTRSEWEHGLQENARRRAQGLEPYMIVTKHAGPVTFPKSYRFFEDGMEGFSGRVGDIALEELDRFVRSKFASRRDTARLRLR